MKVFKRIFKWIFYIVSAWLILAAVLMTCARLMTPLLNDHLTFFNELASRFIGSPVKIERLRATWAGLYPDLHFENVQILQPGKEAKPFSLRSIQIDIDLWHSLLQRTWVLRQINVSGVNIAIDPVLTFTFDAKGKDHAKVLEQLSKNPTVKWILSQERILLQDIRIDWQLQNNRSMPISIERCMVFNKDDQHHHIFGSLKLLDHPDSNINLVLNFNGVLSSPNDMTLKGYLEFNNLKLSNLFWLRFGNFLLDQGSLSAKTWFDLSRGQIDHIQSLIDFNGLSLKTKKGQSIFFKELSGNILWQRLDNGWAFSADQVQVSTQNSTYPQTSFYFKQQAESNNKGVTQLFKAGYFNLKDMSEWLLQTGILPSVQANRILQLKPKGAVRDLFVFRQTDEDAGNSSNAPYVYAKGVFDHLTFDRVKNIPGAMNLTGSFQVDNTQGILHLNSSDTVLDFGTLFLKPLKVDVLSGQVSFYRSLDEGFIVNGQDIIAINGDAALSGNAALYFPHDKKRKAQISLLAGFDLQNSDRVKFYLPLSVLDRDVFDWLSGAFNGGGVSGTVVLKGPLSDFPFDDHHGVFIVSSDVRDLNLHYAPGWPDARGIFAKLIFKDRSMSAHAFKGNVYDAQLQNLEAQIPSMSDEQPIHLLVQGQVQSDVADILKFVKNSPLNETFGEDLAPLRLKGQSVVDVKFDMPLHAPEKLKLQGSVAFKDAALSLPAWQLTAEHLIGKLLFTDQSISSEMISGLLFNEPTRFSIKTQKQGAAPASTLIHLKGTLSVQDLMRYFHVSSLSFLEGQTDYEAQVNLRTAKGDGRRSQLALNSDLIGIVSDLPAPFDKAKEATLPFGLVFDFGGKSQANQMSLRFGKRLSAALTFKTQNEKTQIYNMNILLGDGIAKLLNQEGLFITGQMDRFDLKTWQNALKKDLGNQSSSNGSKMLKTMFKHLNIKFGVLQVWNQTLEDIDVGLTQDSKTFTVSVRNVRMNGSLTFPKDKISFINGNFSRLYLHKVDLKDPSQKFNLQPTELPPIQLHVDHFQYGNEYFGALDLKSHSANRVFIIDRLSTQSPLLSSSVSGKWEIEKNKASFSALTGWVHSDDLEKLFKAWNLKLSLIGTTGTIRFDLKWPGELYNPDLNKLQGSMHIDLGQGWIVNLNEQTTFKLNIGRILSLLNLNRLFSANFGDLTHKGYGFDTVKGDLILNRGFVTVTDLLFDGSVASIAFKGTINMLNKSLNLNLEVMPYVTSSVPVVAAIAGGPVVGAVAFVANKALGKTFDKIVTNYYTVKGTWEDPVVKLTKSSF